MVEYPLGTDGKPVRSKLTYLNSLPAMSKMTEDHQRGAGQSGLEAGWSGKNGKGSIHDAMHIETR